MYERTSKTILILQLSQTFLSRILHFGKVLRYLGNYGNLAVNSEITPELLLYICSDFSALVSLAMWGNPSVLYLDVHTQYLPTEQNVSCQSYTYIGTWLVGTQFSTCTLLDSIQVLLTLSLRIPHVHKPTLIVSTWFSTYSWIVSSPHSVPVYTSCT